jgi:hypothetical protein
MMDIAELSLVDPIDVSNYLRASGWQHAGDYGRTWVFSHPEEDDIEVLIPVSSQLRDYAVWMQRLVDTLADVEQRPHANIVQELRNPNVDVQYIHTMPETPSGTTPLLQGAKAVQGVRDLFLAAATSAVLEERTAVLPAGRRPQQATEFVDQVRLGVPSPGSFVLRVETPIATHGQGGTRAVLQHLYRSVRAAHSAAVESSRVGTPRPFEQQVEHGVSANLCDALAEIGGGQRTAYEFRFAWARTVPMPEETPDIRFDAQHIVALHDAKSHLKKLADTEPAVVIGRSTDLQHRNQSTGRVVLEGTVQLAYGGIEEQRRVSMRLSRNEYAQVVQAHQPDQEARVRVTGLLRKSGRQWEMVSVDNLQILR